jgi:hypothetical protein
MRSNYFDHIEQELTLLQQRLISLKTENADLRQQLNILRSGQGIMIEIAGQRFSVPTEHLSTATTVPLDLPQQDALTIQEPFKAATPAFEIIQSTAEVEDIEEETEENLPVTPTFLEEIMLDEFTVATTNNPMATWNGPIKKQEQINEDQKAALRRELMGSFLLE